jgi:hypothetical protein
MIYQYRSFFNHLSFEMEFTSIFSLLLIFAIPSPMILLGWSKAFPIEFLRIDLIELLLQFGFLNGSLNP